MAIGSFGPITFRTSDQHAIFPENVKRTSGSTWATHDVIGGKSRSEYTGGQLTAVSLDLELNAGLGVRPRQALDQLRSIAESRNVYYLVMGGRPLSMHPFRLVSVSEDWGTVFRDGKLWSAKVSCSFEEYV